MLQHEMQSGLLLAAHPCAGVISWRPAAGIVPSATVQPKAVTWLGGVVGKGEMKWVRRNWV